MGNPRSGGCAELGCVLATQRLAAKGPRLLLSTRRSKSPAVHPVAARGGGWSAAIIRNCLQGDSHFAWFQRERCGSLEGCQQHGFMEQNFAGKGLSINGNLKFTMSVCISARFRILKYLLCQHNYSGLIHLGSTCRSFFWPESSFQPKSGPVCNFAINRISTL